jgi:DNA modification methylase
MSSTDVTVTTVGAHLHAQPAIWLTPRLARTAPIHRWFVFPHSYAPQLVGALLEEFEVCVGGAVLDPFCGAGTTLVEAQRRGLKACGLDMLPLAVLASRAKTERPDAPLLVEVFRGTIERACGAGPVRPPSELLRRAFTPNVYGRLAVAFECADEHDPASRCAKLATLALASSCSRLRADGGWLRVTTPKLSAGQIPVALEASREQMLADLGAGGTDAVKVVKGDARRIPLDDQSIDVVISSPPYPNRHDYTRVFGVELELGWRLGDGVKPLRYQAIHSHPEARPVYTTNAYTESRTLKRTVEAIALIHTDSRISRMLSGYFRDLHDVLCELRRVLKPLGRVALIVGNVRYCGIEVPVDELLVQVAEHAGLAHERTVTLRVRGNSAQQMGKYGRRESREAAVILRRA